MYEEPSMTLLDTVRMQGNYKKEVSMFSKSSVGAVSILLHTFQ